MVSTAAAVAASPGKSPRKAPDATKAVLKDTNFFAKKQYANQKELISRLQLLQGSLREAPEAEVPIYSPDLARALASEHYVRAGAKDVQLLVACIIADVFRLSAPEHPFSAEQLLEIFRLWLRVFERFFC
eukprot:RCo006142